MATLRSYNAAFEQNALTEAAIARYRFNEESGTTAIDSVDDLSGEYRAGAAPGAAGSIGDGAASFDGSGFVVIDSLTGTFRVATLGDSLSSDDFQSAGNAFADDLETALEARGLEVSYFDHAVSGDRTADGLARVDDVLDDAPDVVIIELGTNDAIGEVDPETVEANLREVIAELQGGGVEQILLTGTFGFYPDRVSGNPGYDTQELRAEFEGIFAEIAGDTAGVTLLSDSEGSDKFLGGVRVPGETAADDVISGGVLNSTDPNPLSDDGLHPNDAGIDVIVPRIAPQTIALGAAAGVVNEPLLLASGAFEMWFTADGLEQMLFSKNSLGQGTGGQVAAFLRADDGLTFALGDQTTNYVAASAAGVASPGTPTHLVANFGADGMHLFVNGVEVASNAYTGGLDAGLGNFDLLVVGAEGGFSTPGTTDNLLGFFEGTIDEFAIYDRALTANEVEQLFQGGSFGSTVVGTAEDDTLIGGSAAEELRGGGGNDAIEGGDGGDALQGGRGNDALQGGLGGDELLGGNGDDELHGGAGDDELDGKDGDDLLAGGEGDDRLEGGEGADFLSGAAGDDRLFGNRGADDLHGGDGNDLLDGGQGKDDLTGDAGSDTFRIEDVEHGVDKIHDFEAGVGGDVLDLDAVLNFESGDDFEDFVRLTEVDGNAKVEVDGNGGGDDFTAVFNLIGGAGLDIGNLVDDGNLQLTTPTS